MFDLITDAHLKPSIPISVMWSHSLSVSLQAWAEVLEDIVMEYVFACEVGCFGVLCQRSPLVLEGCSSEGVMSNTLLWCRCQQVPCLG